MYGWPEDVLLSPDFIYYPALSVSRVKFANPYEAAVLIPFGVFYLSDAEVVMSRGSPK